MADLKGSKTQENLKEAFAGESQANRRYLYFAQKADIEGYPDVAALFRSVAEGETGHAFGHFDFLAASRRPGDRPAGRAPPRTTCARPSTARPTSTPRCTRASPAPPATRASSRSPSGWRPGPGREEPCRALPAGPRQLELSAWRVLRGRTGRRSRPRLGTNGAAVTITYDPHHPKYLDEADVREELTRVFDLCHGCRLCFKFCSSFPTLFELIDRHDDQDAAKLTKAEQDQVVDECFQCKLCFVNCPYIPGQSEWEIDFPRLMLRADAMRHATKRGVASAAVTDNVLGRTDLIGKLELRAAPAVNALTGKRGGFVRVGDGQDHGHIE